MTQTMNVTNLLKSLTDTLVDVGSETDEPLTQVRVFDVAKIMQTIIKELEEWQE